MTDFGKEWQLAGRRKDAARKSKTRKRSPPSARCQEEDLDIEKTVKRIKNTTYVNQLTYLKLNDCT